MTSHKLPEGLWDALKHSEGSVVKSYDDVRWHEYHCSIADYPKAANKKKHHKKGLEIDEKTRDSNLWGFRPKDIWMKPSK